MIWKKYSETKDGTKKEPKRKKIWIVQTAIFQDETAPLLQDHIEEPIGRSENLELNVKQEDNPISPAGIEESMVIFIILASIDLELLGLERRWYSISAIGAARATTSHFAYIHRIKSGRRWNSLTPIGAEVGWAEFAASDGVATDHFARF